MPHTHPLFAELVISTLAIIASVQLDSTSPFRRPRFRYSSVPLVCIWIFGEDHLRAVWRVSIGLGLVPAMGVLLWRLVMLKEATAYEQGAIKKNVPYGLVFKKYWLVHYL